MSFNYKILGQLNYGPELELVPGDPGNGYGYGYYESPTEDSYSEIIEPQVLYTVPANTETIITSIFVCNRDLIERTYDLAIVPAGEELALKHHIRWDVPVPANDFDLNDAKLTLSSGDRIYVFPSTVEKIGFTAFGVEKV
jgi:hypothetical protein